jgi:glycosyltransferase involved in cell wall biosynthesis
MKNFVVVITARNTYEYFHQCVDSVVMQKKGDYTYQFIYHDDCSDYSEDVIGQMADYVRGHGGEFFRSENRQYQLGSLGKVIRSVRSPNSIVCLLDGDDYLLPDALCTVSKAYADPRVHLTYGNILVDFRPFADLQNDFFIKRSKLNSIYPDTVWERKSFRDDGLRVFHLRTFKKWLWDKIEVNSLVSSDGELFRTNGDAAFIFPMLEMLSRPESVRFIDKPIYVYRLHPDNVHHKQCHRIDRDMEEIRFKLPRFQPLEDDEIKDFSSEEIRV